MIIITCNLIIIRILEVWINVIIIIIIIIIKVCRQHGLAWLTIRTYQLSLFATPLDSIQCLHIGNKHKLLLVGQHWTVYVLEIIGERLSPYFSSDVQHILFICVIFENTVIDRRFNFLKSFSSNTFLKKHAVFLCNYNLVFFFLTVEKLEMCKTIKKYLRNY